MSDDLEHSFERLLEAVNVASGWPTGTAISFSKGDSGVGVAVEICGDRTSVSAWGKDHRGALVALLQRIESHHVEVARWHVARCKRAREVLDELDIYYIKGATP